MWTMDNTDGFTQEELDKINELHAKLMAEYDVPANAEQFAKSLDDAITNAWGAENLEEAVRKAVSL